MKIFVPAKPDANSYLEEIIAYSQHEWVYGQLDEFLPEYQVLNIHWPEALFNWETPTLKQLEQVNQKLKQIGKSAFIIYTRHDNKSNFETKKILEDLRNIVEEHADTIIHLGTFSQSEYQKKYPDKLHKIIAHPLYKKSFKIYSKKEAKESLKIPLESFVMVAPGRIRHDFEKKLILKLFRLTPVKNKVLICSRMKPFRTRWPFRGKTRINQIVNALFKYIYKPPTYFFNYTFNSFEQLSLIMSAADIVVIPRTNVLNSGILFLGLTFKKPIIGASTGNVTEYLKKFNFPILDPKSKRSIKNALAEYFANHQKYYNISHEEYLKSLHPKKIAEQYDDFFEQLVKNSKL